MMTNNRKGCQKKKHKVNKLIKADRKLDLWAFVEVSEQLIELFNCIGIYPKHSVMNALVSASFGFVLRSPTGSETKPAGEPAPLCFRVIYKRFPVSENQAG